MSKSCKALAHLSGYFICSVITAAAAFLSIPLLTRLLGIEEFGRWLLLEPLQIVLSQVALLGGNYGIVKQITYDGYDPRHLFMRVALLSQPVILGIMFLSVLILPLYGYSRTEALLFAVLLQLESVYLLMQSAFRAASCVTGFTAGTVAKTSFLVVLGWIYLTATQLTIEKVLIWRVATTGAGIMFGLAILAHTVFRSELEKGEGAIRTFRGVYMNGVRYGGPILATGLLSLIIEFADRYIMKATFDYRTLACYLIYVKVAACLTPAITTPFNLWWATERFKRLADEDGGKGFFSHTAVFILVLYVLAGGALWIISPALVRFFAPGVPYEGGIILVLITSVIAMSMAAPLNIGLLNEGRTHLNIIAASAGALLNIALCLVLIRPCGPMGAAVATLLSYAAYSGFLNYLSQRVYPVPFPYGVMLKVLSAAALASAAAAFVNLQNVAGTVAARSLVFAAVLLAIIRPQIQGLATLIAQRRLPGTEAA